jgi:hypothetical protein
METSMKTYAHTTVSGHDLAFEVSVKTKAFLDRLAHMASDAAVTGSDMLALGYSSENPFLDHTMFPGRGAVTANVLQLDEYTVMSDLIYRKEVVTRGVDLEAVAAQYTMGVAEAAATLGVSPRVVKQAIASKRIGAWQKNGKLYLNPQTLAALAHATGTGAAPKAKPALASGDVGAPRPIGRPVGGQLARGASASTLTVVHGSHDGIRLKVRGPGELQDAETISRGVRRGRYTHWTTVVVFIKGNTSGRTFVLERGDKKNVIAFGPFSVEGYFDVTQKVNNGKRAAEVFREIAVG